MRRDRNVYRKRPVTPICRPALHAGRGLVGCAGGAAAAGSGEGYLQFPQDACSSQQFSGAGQAVKGTGAPALEPAERAAEKIPIKKIPQNRLF